MTDLELDNRLYLVTAANSGIGNEIVNALLRAGAEVLVTTRSNEWVGGKGGRLTHITADLLSAHDCAQVSAKLSKLHNFSGVVHVAGAWVPGNITEVSSVDFESAISVNLKTAYNILKVSLPLLRSRGGGSIVTIGSMLGLSPVPNSIAYSSAKAALIQFTKSLALDEGRYGIRCNCVCPGLVDTEQTQNVFQNDKWVEVLTQSYPLGRLGKPSDISGAVRFLLSDAASWMTGLVIPVEGGYLLSSETPSAQ